MNDYEAGEAVQHKETSPPLSGGRVHPDGVERLAFKKTKEIKMSFLRPEGK